MRHRLCENCGRQVEMRRWPTKRRWWRHTHSRRVVCDTGGTFATWRPDPDPDPELVRC